MIRQDREFDTLGVPLKDEKPSKGGNNSPGTAFWLVLIIIGGTTLWQKVGAPPKPVTVLKTSSNFLGMTVETIFISHAEFGSQTGCRKIRNYNFCPGAEKRQQEDSRIMCMVDSAYVT